MLKKIIVALIALLAIFGASQGIETLEVVDTASSPDRRRGLTMRHLRRYFRGKHLPDPIRRAVEKIIKGPGILRRWAARAGRKLSFYLGPGGFSRSIGALTALVVLSCMAIPQSLDPLGINPLCDVGGCWHLETDGHVRASYSDYFYEANFLKEEAWGTYAANDAISGMKGYNKVYPTQGAVIAEKGIDLRNGQLSGNTSIYGIASGTDKLIGHKGSYVLEIEANPDTGTGSTTIGLMQAQGKGPTGGNARIAYIILYTDGVICENADGSLRTKVLKTLTGVHTYQLVFDFIEQRSALYIDGEFIDWTYMPTASPSNACDRTNLYVATGYRGGYLRRMYLSDGMDNLPIHFYDSLNEDTTSEYSSVGATTPTYDSTEKAIKMYEATNLDNQLSGFIRDKSGGLNYNSHIHFRIKKGSNDTSTDSKAFQLQLRSDGSSSDYISVTLDMTAGGSLWVSNIIGGAAYPPTGGSWTPSASTWYEIDVYTTETSAVLFIDGVEHAEAVYTQKKHFYDGELYFFARHDAGEISEWFIKDLLVEDTPNVNAPRSTPVSLMTSGLRPAVEGTFWSDLAGQWVGNVLRGTTSLGANGIFGGSIENQYTGTSTSGCEFRIDSSVDFTKYWGIRFAYEVDNITDLSSMSIYIESGAHGSYGDDALKSLTTPTAANKKYYMTLLFDDFIEGGIDWTAVNFFRIIGISSTSQARNTVVSDIQLLGGPEHDIRGQPLLNTGTVDDTPDWVLGGDTAPTWDAGNTCFNLEDNTAADNSTSNMDRTEVYNMNGVVVIRFMYQQQADDTSTDPAQINYRYIESSAGRINCEYTGTQWNCWLNSAGGVHFYTSYTIAKDTNWHEFVLYCHREKGAMLFIDGVLGTPDYSITGTWTDWTTPNYHRFTSKHDNGEKSHVHIKEIKVERFPLNVHWYQSNELEFLTDTLSPSGSDHMDGDWTGGGTEAIVNTGAPLTNLKFLRATGVPNASNTVYSFDSGADLSRYTKLRFWTRYSGAGNGTIYIRTSSGNQYTQTLAHVTSWKLWELDLPNVTGHGWGTTGSPDLANINDILIFNSTGGAVDCDFYGIQFISEEGEVENFLPQKLQIEEGLEFADGGENVEPSTNPLSVGTGDITVQGLMKWHNPIDTGGSFDGGGLIGSRQVNPGIQLGIDGGGYYFYTRDAGGTSLTTSIASTSIPVDKALNVAGIREGTTLSSILGSFRKVNTGLTVRDLTLGGDYAHVAEPYGNGGDGTDGEVYQVLVYDRALERWEEYWNRHFPKNPIKKGLVLWYDPDEIDGSTWSDLSENAYDGTISAGVDTKRGSLVMIGEKARVYNLEVNGNFKADNSTLTILDLWEAGFQGIGTWQSEINTLTVETETSTFDEGIGVTSGYWNFPGSCAFDHIKINGMAGVAAPYSTIGTLGDCSVVTGVLELVEGSISHIYADATTSYSSMLPNALNRGMEARLEDGIMTDDILARYRKITCANGTQWEFALTDTIKWQDFAVEGTGYFSIYDGIDLVTIGIKFNGDEVEDNTVGAGEFIEALGGGASWTVTRREGDHLYGYPGRWENYRDWINLADWKNLDDYIDKR